MITILFLSFLAMSMTIALVDWRRGWLMAVVCGILQDPVRKLTPGSPVVLTFSVLAVYAVILVAAQATLQRRAREFVNRFSNISAALLVVFVFLVLAAVNGLATFGIEYWKAPALSFFIYCAPVPAVLLGYAWLEREEQMYRFFLFYAVVTSIALTGTLFEFLNLNVPALGMVGPIHYYIRFLPGLQIRMLSGFYRAPDIMGLHAATLSIIGIIMSIRRQVLYRAWPWMLVTGWGFFNCLISGRRKAVYMVIIFAAAFLARYIRRLSLAQIIAFVFVCLTLFGIVHKLGTDEESSVYTKGTATSREEVFVRLEGGLISTVEQFGIMGAGLGTATQGVYHVLPTNVDAPGWQEGGLGKLGMELGLPGLCAVALLALVMLVMMMRISGHPDVAGSSQLLRSALFGLIVANVVQFLVSAQAYSDALLVLMAAFFAGCFFASGVLDERLAAAPAPAETERPIAAPSPA